MSRPDMPVFSFELPVSSDFRFDSCLQYMARSDKECLYKIADGEVRRLLRLGTREVLVAIRSRSDYELGVTVLHGGPLSEREQKELRDYLRCWFDIDRDLVPFYALAQNNGLFGEVVRSFYGLRIVGIPDLFEAVCWAVLGQQVNLSFAYTLKERLTTAYGSSFMWEGTLYRMFPTPQQLLAASREELGGLQLTRMKAAAIMEVAGRMAAGDLSRDSLLAMGDFHVMEKTLLNIKGIGPWTANYVLMRCLGDPGAFPVGDAGLLNAVKQLLNMEKKPTESQLRELFSGWKGWEAYLTFYLWRTLA
ncbi:DNA-3-methyladenine glycosylase family protein [Paenibacillus gansuensis]|uniref:DNA-3-methyladenine glycosylase II n=1 Tax=Paenibacillus gansuensis TaxID=306542 RepID=A0ABW5PD48_9BACL